MAELKIKLYTEINSIPENLPYTFMLIPFLGTYPELSSDPDSGRFLELKNRGTELYELTDNMAEADYFLLAFGYSFEEKHKELINTFLLKAKQHNKKTLIFYNSDDDAKINHENVIVFRTSLNASTKNTYEYALPGWSLDFSNYFTDKKITYLAKSAQPTVSYCGYIDYKNLSVFDSLKKAFAVPKTDYESFAKAIRGKACRVLSQNKNIKSTFIIRNGFWASGINDKLTARKEYAQNMIESIYSIVARGGGNFSYRLYEVLSCGRIPVFINTDCVLPFENEIPWKQQMVWLEEANCNQIDDALLTFHQKTTAEKLIEIQQANRKIYENYVSPFGFFKQLHKHLANQVF